MSKIRKSLATAGVTTALFAGAAGGLVLIAPGFAGAQADGSTTTTVAKSDSKSDSKSSTKETVTKDLEKLAQRRTERLTETLKPLVDDGTITQAQSDAVVKKLVGDEDTWARKGRRINRSIFKFSEAAEALGMTTEDLKAQVQEGKTLAQIAESKGVSTDDLAAAMVKRTKTALDKSVADGKLTQAEADERLAKATERVQKTINSTSLDSKVERMGRMHKRLNQDKSESNSTEKPADKSTADSSGS